MDENQSRFPPRDIRDQVRFFVAYYDAKFTAVQIQLEDQRSYDIWAEDFGRCPQIMRLPLWEDCLRLACEHGQAAYIFGETEDQDQTEPVRLTEQQEDASVTRGLRSDAIQARGKGQKSGRPYESPWNNPAFRHPQR